MSLDPADPWREWAFGEFLAVAGQGSVERGEVPGELPEQAYTELAERCGLPSLADPFVYGVGGLYGVVVLAAELLPQEERLVALAASLLMDPHRIGVAQFVADAREMASLRAPFWGAP